MGLFETIAHQICDQVDVYSIYGTQLIELPKARDVFRR
jgi:hypothetical protein